MEYMEIYDNTNYGISCPSIKLELLTIIKDMTRLFD